jgi:hypothetical protein
VSGALGLFSREAVLAAGGYRTDTLGEDMELVMRLQRWARLNGRRRAVRFVASAVAWTEVPENLSALARQRARWHQVQGDSQATTERLHQTTMGVLLPVRQEERDLPALSSSPLKRWTHWGWADCGWRSPHFA